MNKLPEGFQEWTGSPATSNTLNGFQEWDGGDIAGPAKAEDTQRPVSSDQDPPRKPASVDEFVQQIFPIAQRIAQKIGAPVDAVIGQLGLETGWGESVIPGTNNYGNIKDTSGKGVAATDNMNGSRDRYRQYASAEEFADDYAKLVGTNPRYKGAVGAKDAQGFFTGLKQGGYAEDPNYVQSGVAASRTAAESLKKAGFKQESASLPDMTGIPKWSEISTSAKYAKLPDAEKARMKNAYFDEVLSPYIAADGLDVAAEKAKFIGVEKKEEHGLISRASDAAAGVFKAMNPFSPTPGLMDGVSQTVRQENTDRFNMPLSADTRAKLDYQYEKSTPEQRAQLGKADGVVGMYFTERNKQYADRDSRIQSFSDVISDPAFTDIGDPRFEARTRQLIRSGMTAEGAKTYARTEMQMGMTPGGIKPGSATESDFDFELQDRFKNAPAAIRGAVKGYQGYKQGSLGILQAAANAIGSDEAAAKFAKGSSEAQGVIDAVGDNKNKAGQIFEGAISSIAQQMPMLIGSAVTNSEAIVLGSMAVQSFGQEYAQGRSQNLSGGDAAKRASLFAAFEVVGEKFGLGNTLKALRMSAAGAPTKDLAMELSKALIKEIPGELITTTGQFATDKVSSFGLNQEAGMAEYLSQVGDTIDQTVMQSALMMGGTGGVSTTARHLQNRSNNGAQLSEIYANDARDRALSKWESNPLVRPTQSPQAEQSPQAAPQSPQAHPTSQVADAVVRDLAAAAGMDVESLIPTKTLLVQPAAVEPIAAVAEAQGDSGIADQSANPESRELELWLKSSDSGLTPDEQAELSALQNTAPQEQPTNGIEQWPAASPDVATQSNDVQSADVQRSDGDQRRDVGEGQRPDTNAEASLPSVGEDLALRDEGPIVQALNPSINPQQEILSEPTSVEAQQAAPQGIEPQQVQADAAPGIAPWPGPAQPVTQAQTRSISRTVPDDLLGMLNASGGISSSIKSDIDQDAKGRPGLYRAAGRNIDEIGALMAEHGYITPDQAGDSATVLEMLRRAVGGERIMTAQGMENARAKEEAARYRADLVTQAKQLGINPVGKNIEKLAAVIEQEVAQRNAISEARRQSLIQESAEAEQAIDDVLAMFGSGSPSFKWLVDKFAEVSQRETSDQRKSGYDSLVRATRQAIKKWYADQARIDAVIEKSMEDGYGSTENPFGQGEGVTEQIEPVTAAEGDGSGSVRRSDASREGFALEIQTEQSIAEKVAREQDQTLADKQTADAQREGFTLSAQTAQEVRSENIADVFGEASGEDIQKGKEIERERQLARGQSAPADLFSSPESKPDQETESSSSAGSDQFEDVLGMVNQEQATQENPSVRTGSNEKQLDIARAETPESVSQRFPDIADVKGMDSGLGGVVEPRRIAEGKTLYREVGAGGLHDLLGLDGQAELSNFFVADNPDLALGQGDNKGVQVEFRPNSLSGAEHKKPGTGDVAGREYRVDIRAPRAVQSVTMKASDLKLQRGIVRRVLANEFKRTDLPDGRVRFDRLGLESDGPMFSRAESRTPPTTDLDGIRSTDISNPNPKSTVEQVTKELAGEGSLGDNIQVIQSALDLPANERRQVFKSSSADIGLQAVFFPDSGRVYLIADNIEPGEALSALLHDGGVHAGLYGMLGERGINSLAAQIKDWSINSLGKEEGRIAKLALARIPESTSPNHKNEEVVAYFITEAVNAGHGDPKPTRSSAISRWFARLWKMVESAITKLGANPSSLTVDDVVALARGALERVKSGDIDPRRTQNDPMESRSSKYSPEQNEFRKKAGIGARPTIRQKIARWAEGMKESISWQAFRQGALDQFHGIKLAEVATIGALPVEQSAYVTARLATGSSSVMAGLLGHGQAKWAANGQHLEKIEGTKGLLDVLKPVEGQLDDFLGWMVATRASRLMKEGRENNFTDADIQAGLSLANGKEELFKQVAKDFADFKRSVLDIAEQAGLIDPAGRKVWDHADWIPFYRQMQDDTTKAPGGKRGLSKQSSGIRQLKGGESAINDPLENILLNFQHLIDASLKNNALRKVIGNVEGRTNSSEFLESAGYGMQGALIPRDQIKKQLIAAGTPQQMIDALPAEALFGMAKMWALHAPEGKDIIRVMENGKPHFYRVTDPLLLKAVTSFEPFNIPGLATMRAFKRLLTRSVTATPAFMARNFIRDSASSAIISRDRSAVLGALRGVVKSYTEAGGYETMMFAGASFAGGQTDGADPESTAKAMRRELRKKGFSAASADEFMASVLDKPIKLWDAYSQIGEAIENANREAVYEAAKRSGKSDTAASFEALDLMDFRLRGSHAAYQIFADIIPFVNARIQGMYRLGRSDMKQVAVRGGLFLMIPSVLLALANAGNDEYEELPDWDKDTYWHFFVGGKHFRLPKPFEVGVMFGTTPERITRASLGNDSPKKLASRVWFNIAEQFNLVQWPQFMKPAIEVAMNEDGFSKRPIETIGDKAMIPSMRASYYTSDTMKALAGLMPGMSDATGMSPKRLQHLWNGYLGSVGSAVLGLADVGVRKVQAQPARESMRKDEYPLLGIFYRENPAKNSKYVEEIYKMAQESAELKKSFDAARKAQNKERAEEILADNKDKIKSAEMLGHAAASMSSSSKKIEAIRKNAELTQDQKREQIDAVIKRRNEIAEKVAKRAITAWGGSI